MKKKFLSFLFTLLLLFSLSSNVFAEESYSVSDKYAPTATFQIGNGQIGRAHV